MQIANYELFVLSLRREVVYLQTARGDFGQHGDKAHPGGLCTGLSAMTCT